MLAVILESQTHNGSDGKVSVNEESCEGKCLSVVVAALKKLYLRHSHDNEGICCGSCSGYLY